MNHNLSLIEILLDIAVELLGGDIGSIMLIDPKEEGILKIAAAKGLPKDLINKAKVKIGTCIAGKVITCGLPVVIRAQQEKKEIGILKDDLKRKDINWSFILPIYHGNIPIGVINIACLNSEIEFEYPLDIISKNLTKLINRYLFYLSKNVYMPAIGIISYIHEITVDPLTGLYTYGQLWARLEEEINRSKRFGYNIAIVMVDIDHFKNINIRFGYQVGDKLLQNFSEWMREELRKYSVIARTGGAKFTIMLPETDMPGGIKVAKRLLWGINEISKKMKLNEQITLSIGISEFPKNADSATQLLEKAEESLISAKIMGGDSIKTATEQPILE